MSDENHNPCAACGSCCRSYLVPLCGYDIWLISRGQRLSPEQFLVAYPLQEQGIDRFRLNAADTTCYGMMLDKQGPLEVQQPCVFLLSLADGTTRCGIYEQRPVTCRSYPMTIWKQRVKQRGDVLCPPDSWPPSQVQRPSWRTALQHFYMQFDIYHEIVARWNVRVDRYPQVRFTMQEYYSYLLNVYDRLGVLAQQTAAEKMDQVIATWPSAPRPTMDEIQVRVAAGDMPWLEYLSQTRQIIDGFYPEIQPLPLLFLAPVYEVSSTRANEE